MKLGLNANGGRKAKAVNSVLEDEMRDIHAMVRQRTKIMSDKMKAKYDKAMNSKSFIEGD